MPVRRLPVRPDPEQLHSQTRELLRAIRAGDAPAIAEFGEHHPKSIDPSAAKLADAASPRQQLGPPMTFAANLGRDDIIRLLHTHGANDVESAAGRAALQGKAQTVRLICDLAGRPSLDKWTLAGPAYTVSIEGTAVLLALWCARRRAGGVDRNTIEHLLGTDSRNPPAKHRTLEMYVEHGFEPPDTLVMALHRGRIAGAISTTRGSS